MLIGIKALNASRMQEELLKLLYIIHASSNPSLNLTKIASLHLLSKNEVL
jgi:hypothetical protein